jgi:hypothetical protein
VASPKEERLAVLGIFMHINQFWQGWRGPRLPDTNRLAEKPGNIEARRPHGASDAARGHGVELLHRDIGLAGRSHSTCLSVELFVETDRLQLLIRRTSTSITMRA